MPRAIHQPKAPATRHPPSTTDRARASRQRQARWAFYGKLGTLRLAESALRIIHESYANRNGYLIDGTLHTEIYHASIALGRIRKALMENHKDDWRLTP